VLVAYELTNSYFVIKLVVFIMCHTNMHMVFEFWIAVVDVSPDGNCARPG